MYTTKKFQYAAAVFYLLIALYNLIVLVSEFIAAPSMISVNFWSIAKIILSVAIAIIAFKSKHGFTLSICVFFYGFSSMLRTAGMMGTLISQYFNAMFSGDAILLNFLLLLSSLLDTVAPRIAYLALAIICLNKDKSNRFLKAVFRLFIKLDLLGILMNVIALIIEQLPIIDPNVFAQIILTSALEWLAPLLLYKWLAADYVTAASSINYPSVSVANSTPVFTEVPVNASTPEKPIEAEENTEEDTSSGSKNI